MHQGKVRSFMSIPDQDHRVDGGLFRRQCSKMATGSGKTIVMEGSQECVKAVNQHGGFGIWQWSVLKDPADVAERLENVNEV